MADLPLEKLAEQKQYQQIAKVIRYLSEHQLSQPSLADLAAAMDVGEHHLQRTFSAWVGVSPKQFLQYLTKEYAKLALQRTSVMDTAHMVGLSGSSRLYDLFVTHESVTPGEYKTGGAGITIYYAAFSSSYGYCFLASTERGVCKISFFDDWPGFAVVLSELKATWPRATLLASEERTLPDFEQLFKAGELMADQPRNLRLLLKGTPFRLQVWEALMRIPAGSLASYKDVASAIGRPSATRAVASAIAHNELAGVIPCHRVIRETGAFNQYRWGAERKAMMIAREAAHLA